MDQPQAPDVLVVGAGPTGLTLACDLARRGVAVRIIDREPAPNRASKAKAIHSRSLEVLDDLGAVAYVLDVGRPELPVRYHDADGSVTDGPSISKPADERFRTPYVDPLWIGQFHVEHALRERLAELGREVEYGVEAVGLDQDEDGVTVRLRTSEGVDQLRARFVVGADGGHSSVRGFVNLPLLGETYERQRWYLGDVTVPGLDRGHMHIWTSERGFLGLTPLPGSDLWQFQSPIRPGETPDEEPAEPSLEFYQRLFDERAGADKLRLTSADWLSIYRVNVRMVQRYREGRVLLAGDAAHVHSPAGGHGMNTGIQDAYNLGWKLTSAVDGARFTLLDSYDAERIPVARHVLESSTTKMHRTVEAAGTASGDGLAGSLGTISDGTTTTGLGIHYRQSPLTYPRSRIAPVGVRAGDRAPNVRGLCDRHGSRTLFDLLRGPHWSLLAYEHHDPVILEGAKPTHMRVHRIGGPAGPGGPAGDSGASGESAIQDDEGDFAAVYEPVPSELILIRPDGYIAARLLAEQEADLIEHLAPHRSRGTRL